MDNVIKFPNISTSSSFLAIPEELDYHVKSAPALFEPIPGAGVVDGMGFQNFRTDTEQALGMVKERYQIVQNQELFESLAHALDGAAPARASIFVNPFVRYSK